MKRKITKEEIEKFKGNCDYCINKKFKGVPNKHCVIPQACLPPENNNWVFDEEAWKKYYWFNYETDNELTKQEKIDRHKSVEDTGFVDWNEFSLDKLVKYLEEKYKFDNSGDAHAIFRLIEFYKKNK